MKIFYYSVNHTSTFSMYRFYFTKYIRFTLDIYKIPTVQDLIIFGLGLYKIEFLIGSGFNKNL